MITKKISYKLEEISEKLHQLWKKNKPEEALRELQIHFATFKDQKEFYGLLVQGFAMVGNHQMAKLCIGALENFNSAPPFFKLACVFGDQKLLHFAIPLLQRAHKLDPKDGFTIHELAILLSFEGYFQESLKFLEKHPQKETSFWIHYEKTKNLLFLGEVQKTEEELLWLKSACLDAPENQKDAVFYAYQKLEDTFSRFQIANPPKNNLYHWYFILYRMGVIELGTNVLLENISKSKTIHPIGSFGEMLQKASKWIQYFIPQVNKVYWLPDIDSEITGRLLAHILGLPTEKVGESETTKNSVVVAGNGQDFSESFSLIPSNQVLFSAYLPQFENSRICPDLVGYLLQEEFFFPWEKFESSEKEPQKMLNYIKIASSKELDQLLAYHKEEHIEIVEKEFYEKVQSKLMGANCLEYPKERYSFRGESLIPTVKKI